MIWSPVAILIGAALATLGWVYTGRRARELARKQHTISVMVQANFSSEFRNALKEVSPYIKECKLPDDMDHENNKNLGQELRFVLNHYEFMCSGLRNGDFDEQLVKDSERGTIVSLFACAERYIYSMRDTRDRQSIYEHLEWVTTRWTEKNIGFWQRRWEALRMRPNQGKRAEQKAKD